VNEDWSVNNESTGTGWDGMTVPLCPTKYDYREKWLEITEVFSACHDTQEIYDHYLEWLRQTFDVPRITIWKRFNADGQFHQIRPVNSEDQAPPIFGTHSLIQRILANKGPFKIDEDGHEDDGLRELAEYTQAFICVPLITTQEGLLGFCTLSKGFEEQTYDHDDCDLLRVIAHHVTMLILQFQLVEEWTVRAKWEAVHKFSGFYLHDLKNLASSLSLVAQNAAEYGHDPAFQASAMRTVRQTSQRIMDLMAKLADESRDCETERERNVQTVDINGLMVDMLESVRVEGCRTTFHAGEAMPSLSLRRESIQQVLLNVILNAQQAMNGKGAIDITTTYDEDRVYIEIVDTGPGIPAARLENLFQPFTSSKENGLGVGLFHCKQMVEDNQGQIRIESQEGHGTKVILSFPHQTAETKSGQDRLEGL
jgi:putative PEP-CTERM system histidine kinase